MVFRQQPRGERKVMTRKSGRNSRQSARSAIVLVTMHLLPASSLAQATIPDSLTCPQCRIQAEVRMRLGDEGGVPGPPAQILLDSRGRRWVAFAVPAPVVVFDSTGALLGIVGRAGDGPSEFRSPNMLLNWRGDSIAVFDPGLGRVSFVGPDLVVGRTARLPGSFREAVPDDFPEVLLSGRVPTPESLGYPIHRVDMDASPLRVLDSFGAERPIYLPTHPEISVRHVSPAAAGGLWLSHLAEYRWERWSREGLMLERFARSPEWFSSPSSWSMGNHDTPPPPMLDGMF